MAVERTLAIIKPDAVAKNAIGEIYARFEKAGLRIAAARMLWLSRADAGGFYAVHRERAVLRDLRSEERDRGDLRPVRKGRVADRRGAHAVALARRRRGFLCRAPRAAVLPGSPI